MTTMNLGFEQSLWDMADKLRGNIESSEYKHVVLGLIFLKYISDGFEEKYNQLATDGNDEEEIADAYIADNVFFVPADARWEIIKNHAKQPNIGQIIDNAMIVLEKNNPSLKGVLPKNYARPEIDKTRLAFIIFTPFI